MGSVQEVAGYPAYTWSEECEKVPVEVLISEQLGQGICPHGRI